MAELGGTGGCGWFSALSVPRALGWRGLGGAGFTLVRLTPSACCSSSLLALGTSASRARTFDERSSGGAAGFPSRNARGFLELCGDPVRAVVPCLSRLQDPVLDELFEFGLPVREAGGESSQQREVDVIARAGDGDRGELGCGQLAGQVAAQARNAGVTGELRGTGSLCVATQPYQVETAERGARGLPWSVRGESRKTRRPTLAASGTATIARWSTRPAGLGLASAAETLGVRVAERPRVTRIERSGKRLQVRTQTGRP